MRRASSISIGQAKKDALRDLRESAKPKEHTERGNVKKHVYKAYIAAASVTGVAFFFTFMVPRSRFFNFGELRPAFLGT